MFTDMEHKHHPEDYLRPNSSLEQEVRMLNKRKRTKSKDPPGTPTPTKPISVRKSTPNSKVITNFKQGSKKKETPDAKPNVILRSPSHLAKESGCNTKQQQKQARTVKKSKQLNEPQGKLEYVKTECVSPRSLHGQLKIASTVPQVLYDLTKDYGIDSRASRVPKKNPGTPQSAISSGSKGTRSHKPQTQHYQLTTCNSPEIKVTDMVSIVTPIPKATISTGSKSTRSNKPQMQHYQLTTCNSPEIRVTDMVSIATPGLHPDECKAPINITPNVDKTNRTVCETFPTMTSNLRDTNTPKVACLTELTRTEEYYRIQRLVEQAIRNHKIFLIRGDIPYLEESMRARGWVQKYESTKTRMVPYGSVASLDAPSLGDIHLPDGTSNEKAIVFQMLRHVPPDFIWDCRNEFTDWNSNVKQTTLLNRFQKSFVYTSKLGMATMLEDAHWNYEEKVSSVQCPRSYNVNRDRNAFIDDYRMTAAVSLLKWFVEQIQKGVELAVRGSSPISLRQIEFAIKRCEQFVAVANNDHLDTPQTEISSQEWEFFIQDYIKAVHQENGFVETAKGPPFPEIEILYVTANTVLKKVKDVDPQFELNGHRNIWILKPSDLCCGVGIVMTHKLNHIMKRVHDCARDYFVVQKYIEKPLLVQDTKFDVRQWYLVTKSYPLTIWIYKESFLRFSSRPFSFANYHEAVHICNTAVQCKYADQRNSVRAKNWDCQKINDYLKKAGYNGEPWYDQVYPKMCEAIIATMLAAQQHMDKRRCSFELYGADFVIMNDLSVWLIEINTNPRMHPPSTKVTERLYPDVMESLVKVILDYPENPNADTGNFVLAYQQNVTTFQPYLGASMFVLGKAITQNLKNSNVRKDSMNPWTPSRKEKQNEAALVPQNQSLGNSNFPITSHVYSR